MTPAAFETARQRTRCRADSRAVIAARRVLVDGISRHQAAREAGVSASAVCKACIRIESAATTCPTCSRPYQDRA